MQINIVLWDCKCPFHWPAESGGLEVSPGQQSQKSGHQTGVQVPFQEILETRSTAKGRHKDGIPGFGPWSKPQRAPRRVPRQEPAPKAKAPGQAIGFFTEQQSVSVGCPCSALGVVARENGLFICYSPMGPRDASPADHQSRQSVDMPWVAAIKARAQTHGEAPVRERRAFWRGLQWMLTSVCASLEACPSCPMLELFLKLF